MTTNAKTSQGIQLKRGDGATTEVFTLIAEINSIDGPDEKAKQIDVSTLDSTGHEYIAGLFEGGSIKITGNSVFSNAQQTGLRADMISGVRRNFKLLLTDTVTTSPTTYSFTAVVVAFGIKGEVDKQVMFSAELKISGVPTIAAAA